jgi:hypothetical protein
MLQGVALHYERERDTIGCTFVITVHSQVLRRQFRLLSNRTIGAVVREVYGRKAKKAVQAPRRCG